MDVIQREPTTPGELFSSKEQARNWLCDLATAVREARAHCDLERDASTARSWARKLLVRYGAAKGALDALYRTGHLDDDFHSTLSEQLLVAIAAKVTDADAADVR